MRLRRAGAPTESLPVPHSPFRLLTLHYAAYQFSVAIAGGFVGAYLLKLGFSLSAALAAYAGLLAARCGLRFLGLMAVRRFGYRATLLAGVALTSTQFLPLLYADDVRFLIAWVLVASLAEALYWPVYHAAVAVTGVPERRGREIGLRTAVGSLIGVAGPVTGGLLLQHAGAAIDFAIAAALMLLSMAPLLALPAFDGGPIPAARDALRMIDHRALIVFSTDGWMTSSTGLVWPMALFLSLGGQFDTLGLAHAAAGVAGAIAGLLCGRGVDAGKREAYLLAACGALTLGFLLRAAASWSPAVGVIANMGGAVVAGLYVPLLMSMVYDRAMQSGAAYRFHFVAEAGWDIGGAAGCLTAALVALMAPAPSLAVLPGGLGVASLYLCLRQRKAEKNAPSVTFT